ncbi:tryptophan 7-halogenase [Streptomyces sp. NPDC048349]|uniref:NAD(P)/FAD-dependent oxidoreductase n=1 Tax=Streptomyces sp. NPDC048349 TaxID=3155486 RepID=UPI00341EAC64
MGFTQLVDATGRAGVLGARQLGVRRVHDVFRNVAVWGYWRGATALPQAPEGSIGVFSLPDHGWLWAIPLHDGTLSVGLVTDKRSFQQARDTLGSIDAVYEEALGRCPLLRRILQGARQDSALKTESDYSYTAEAFCGPGWYLAGDAACFLDPLLSTGVHLAMYSGLLSAAAITAVLRGEVDLLGRVDCYALIGRGGATEDVADGGGALAPGVGPAMSPDAAEPAAARPVPQQALRTAPGAELWWPRAARGGCAVRGQPAVYLARAARP